MIAHRTSLELEMTTPETTPALLAVLKVPSEFTVRVSETGSPPRCGELLSVTVSEKLNVPVSVGVPESAPDIAKLNHAGSDDPLLTAQV